MQIRRALLPLPLLLLAVLMAMLQTRTYSRDADRDGISDAVEHQLLEQFRPYLRFTRDHGMDEHFNPTDVMFYLSCSEVIESGDENSTTILPNSTLSSNPSALLKLKWQSFGRADITVNKNLTGYHINPMENPAGKPGGNAGRHGNAWNDISARPNVGLYGHVVPYLASSSQGSFRNPIVGIDPNHTYYKIEYWQFFGYNNAAAEWDIGDHEGDWTTVQLLVDPDQNYKIISVFHFAHGLSFRFDMSAATNSETTGGGTIREYHGKFNPDIDLVHHFSFSDNNKEIAKAQNNVVQFFRNSGETEYLHPVVYVEYGTHEFYPSRHWSFFYAPKHTGDSPHSYLTTTPPNLGEVEGFLSETPAAEIILRYSGFWGAYSRKNSPPRGPAFHDQWTWPASSQIRGSLPHRLGY